MTKDEFIAALQTDEQKQRFQVYCDILEKRLKKDVNSAISKVTDPCKMIDALLAEDKKKADALKAKQDLENLIVECKKYGIDPIKVLNDTIKEQKKAELEAMKAEIDAKIAALG